MEAQEFEDLLGGGGRFVEAEDAGALFEAGDGFQDLDLGLVAEAGKPGDLAAVAGGFQRRDGIDAQRLVQRGDLFRAESGDVEQLEEAVGIAGAELLVEFQFAGGRELVELVAQGLADALDPFELLLAGQRHDVAVVARDDFRALAVGADLEGILALDL